MNISEIDFSNQQVDTSLLPDIDDINYQSLHKDYLTAELIGLTIFCIILSGIIIAVSLFNNDNYPFWINYLSYGLALTLITSMYTLTILGFRRKQYAIRNHDIIYRKGLIWRSTTIIPFNRIQHVEVQQGPIERLFDLGRIKIYTAGGSNSDLIISGISYVEAQRIKHFILNKTALDEEE